MTGERTRGLVLYALASTVLLAGAGWYVRAAPGSGVDARVAGWRRDAVRLLPDLPTQAGGGVEVLTGPAGIERSVRASVGSYRLSMVCAGGGGDVWIRLSETGNDSGRPVRCAERPTTVEIRVALADELNLHLAATIDRTESVVFCWRLTRTDGI
jgi:hypothetical protein